MGYKGRRVSFIHQSSILSALVPPLFYPWAYSAFCASSHHWACFKKMVQWPPQPEKKKREQNNENNSEICVGSSFLILPAPWTEEAFAYLFISCGECPRACNEIKLPPYLTTLLTKKENKWVRAKRVSWDGSAESLLSGGGDKPGCPKPNQITTQQQSQAALTGRMNGLRCCIEAQGIALFNTPVSHSGDQYTIRPWLYPHLINLSIRIDRACHGVRSQTDKALLSLKAEHVFAQK